MLGRLVRAGAIISAASLAQGCEEPPEVQEAAPPASVSAAVSAVELRLPPVLAPSSEAAPTSLALDLQPTEGGAVIAWSEGASIHLQRIDASGDPVGSVASLSAATDGKDVRVSEIAIAASGARLGLAWIAERDGSSQVVVSHGGMKSRDFATPRILAKSEPGARSPGRLAAAAAPSGRLMLLYRGPQVHCRQDRPERCSSFVFSELGGGKQRRRPGLVVPEPCGRAVVGVAMMGSHWHYGVCSIDGGLETTTLFTARPDPAYAQAEELMPGCAPLGMTAIGDDLWVSASCGGRRAARRLRGIETDRRAVDMGAASLRCKGDNLEIVSSEHGPRLEVAEPTGALAPLLPSAIAPAHARAVWTGRALVVATPAEGRPSVARHRCFGQRLRVE